MVVWSNILVERLLQSGNVSALFSPVSDYNYLPSDDVFVGDPPLNSLQRGDFKKVNIIKSIEINATLLTPVFLRCQ